MRQATAVLLAGSRPGPDPLLNGDTQGATKAALPVAGRPMLTYPLAALSGSGNVGEILVYAQQPGDLWSCIQDYPLARGRVSKSGIAATLVDALEEHEGPLLVTTADNVLLTTEMVRHFIEQVNGADVAVAMVDRRSLAAAGYSTRRTWLKFRGGAWSGANLFWLAGPQCVPLVKFWASVEQDRKKGWRIVSAFGPWLALQAALRLATIHTLVRQAGSRFGVAARVVPMPQAEACIDADTQDDIALIERILARRQPSKPVE